MKRVAMVAVVARARFHDLDSIRMTFHDGLKSPSGVGVCTKASDGIILAMTTFLDPWTLGSVDAPRAVAEAVAAIYDLHVLFEIGTDIF
jgi:hypothetical protein